MYRFWLLSLSLLGVLGLLACEQTAQEEAAKDPVGQVLYSMNAKVSQSAAMVQNSLVFDPVEVDLGHVVEGEKVNATLLIRNNGNDFEQIVKVESSCGCTTAEPETRMLAAGAFTPLHIEIDTFGKRGEVRKSITMTDQKGREQTAWLKLNVQENPHAMNDKRSIFDGKCAQCHAEPAQGRVGGGDIYIAVCAMCHGEKGRGAYAPELVGKYDMSTLSKLIAKGTGSHHMPAFAKENGGPLSVKQIHALSKWLISLDE